MKFNKSVTKQPRKKRRQAFKATLKDLTPRAHLSKELREKEKKRSVCIHEGDSVKVSRGAFKGKSGKVSRVNVKLGRVFVEGLFLKKQSGQEKPAPIDPSNVVVTAMVERKGLKK
ncbi:50S ribosomal protein L24 [Candidatus Micrarchaeota archaeon CG09_land_8_20_14_0_10_55_25]|nr:MAG: 50S ribosomal protein L24 [Candidatus Micrarchaeota archaeon CG09_land_8_20_14_0_10_55_25]